jgi:hypothetical protein
VVFEHLTPDAAPLARTPSQKELAYVFGITSRHLRRLEEMESSGNQPCGRPYNAFDLWRLFRRRHPKRWNRAEAERLKLADLCTQFEEMLFPRGVNGPSDDYNSVALLMLGSIAWQDHSDLAGASALPRLLGANLAQSTREQLRAILQCPDARAVLARAFFEAALMADSSPSEEPVALTALLRRAGPAWPSPQRPLAVPAEWGWMSGLCLDLNRHRGHIALAASFWMSENVWIR